MLVPLPPAVVPIFVNAGAAILPAIIAGLTSLLALLLSPKALLALLRRKPWIPLVIAALITAAIYAPRLLPAATAPPVAAKQIDWPAIAHDLQLAQATPHALLTPLWHHDLDGTLPMSTPTIFSPLETRNSKLKTPVLYLPTTLMDIASLTGVLYAIDPLTGRQLWTVTKNQSDDYLKPFFSSPAVTPDGKFLLVGQGLHDDKDSPLLCFKLPTLSPQSSSLSPPSLAWSLPTSLHVESSPAVFLLHNRPTVVVGVGAIEGKDRLPIGNPGYVLCADIITGKQLWQFPLADAESSPAVDENNIIYIGSGFNGNAVAALRPDSDADLKGQPRLLWKTPTPFPAVGDVTLATDKPPGDANAPRTLVLIGLGNGDYVVSDPYPAGAILALDRTTGKIAWQTPLPDAALGPLKLTANNTILAPCRNGQAYALNLSTGQILWHTQISSTPNTPLLAGLVTDGPHAFALAADGTLAILATSTGQLLQRTKLADDAKSPQNRTLSTPLYQNGILYIATETTGLQAYKVSP